MIRKLIPGALVLSFAAATQAAETPAADAASAAAFSAAVVLSSADALAACVVPSTLVDTAGANSVAGCGAAGPVTPVRPPSFWNRAQPDRAKARTGMNTSCLMVPA